MGGGGGAVIMFTASLVVYKYKFERLLEEHVNILLKTSFATVIDIYLFFRLVKTRKLIYI